MQQKRSGNRPETIHRLSPFFHHNNFCRHRMEIKHNSMTIFFAAFVCFITRRLDYDFAMSRLKRRRGKKVRAQRNSNRNKDSNRWFRQKEKQKKIELSCVRVRWICSGEMFFLFFISIKIWRKNEAEHIGGWLLSPNTCWPENSMELRWVFNGKFCLSTRQTTRGLGRLWRMKRKLFF